MKAEDLMIGDFFIYKGNVVEIVSIDGGTETVWIDGKKVSALRKVSDLQSIPLTPEILEKNGFNIEIAPFTPGWMRCILNPNFFLEDRLKGFFYFNGNNLAKIQYIQELQHALKLCGIDKTIEL